MKEFSDIKRIVVKIGSSSLTHSGGGINFRKIDRIAMVLSDIKNMGKEVILVTSALWAPVWQNWACVNDLVSWRKNRPPLRWDSVS